MTILILEKIGLKTRISLENKKGHLMMSIDQENTKIAHAYTLINKDSKYVKQSRQPLILPF